MQFPIIDDIVEKNLLDKVWGNNEDKIEGALSVVSNTETLNECTEAEIKDILVNLSRYSFHLQDQSADYYAKVTALQKHLAKESAVLVLNMDLDRFIPFEDRKLIAINSSPELDNLYNLMVEYEIAYNRISKLHFPINEIIKKIELRINKNERQNIH